jgi:hypothetical protein
MKTSLSVPVLFGLVTLAAFPARLSAEVRDANGSMLDKSRMSVVKDSRGDRLLVWVTFDGLRARERPRALGAANSEIGVRLPFLKDAAVSRKDVRGDDRQLYALLIVTTPDGDGVQDVVGWVDQRYLLMSYEPLRDADTLILQKSMIVITVDSVSEGFQKFMANPRENRFGAIEARLGPSPDAATSGELIRLSNLFFVYGRAPGYTLIGRRPLINPASDGGLEAPGRVILGWLPNDRVIQWRTREATYWSPDAEAGPHRQVPGEVFTTSDGAFAALRNKGADPATESTRITVEDMYQPGIYGRPLRPQQMRFPILNETEPEQDSHGNVLMKVGTIGSFRGVAADNQKVELPPEEMGKITRDIAELGRASKQVELLFVVDETNSLKPWFPVVADTIKRMLAPIANERGMAEKADVRIGIAFYGDDFQGNTPSKPGRLMPASQFLRVVLPRLAEHATQDGGDAAEQVFFGLGQAIDFAGFNNASHKLVVLIGDCGNKAVKGSPSMEDLVEKLVRPRDKKWRSAEYYAIQVGRKEVVEKDPDALHFREEQIALKTLVNTRRDQKYPGLSGPAAAKEPETLSDFINVYSPSDSEGMITSIVNRYYRLRRRALEMGDELDRVRLAFSTRLSPETEQQLIARGVPIDQLKNVQGAQVFQEGYVWRRNARGQEQLRDYLLISLGELGRFYDATAGLEMSPEELGALTAQQFISRMLAAMGGEAEGPDRALTLSQLAKKRSGFPLQSPLFKRLKPDAQDFRLNAQELADIQWKRAKLKDITDKLHRDWVAERKAAGGGLMITVHHPLKASRDVSRGFYMQDEVVEWFWIDLKEEWP